MSSFDLAVIGSGPGGLDAALHASELGLKVALIEKKQAGGTCLNTGCIPTKTLLASSRFFAQMKQAENYGLNPISPAFEWSSLMKRKNEIIDRLRSTSLQQIQKSGIEWIEGHGKLIGPRKIRIQGSDSQREIEATAILIATGSEVSSLPGLDFDGKNILSSTDALNLEKLPKSLLIAGGGAVGVEFASLFQDLGVQVTLIEMMDRLLPLEDTDCAKRLENLFSRRGIKVITGSLIESYDHQKHGLLFRLRGGETVEAEKILIAAGRKRCVADMGLSEAGIGLDAKGAVQVNEFFETTQPGIFAIGDIIQAPQLAHAASAEGILVAENLNASKKRILNYSAIPSCVYSRPEIASVGLNQVRKKQETNECAEVRIPFAGLGKNQAEGETDGFFKLFAEKNRGTVLGGAAIGSHVTELIPEVVLAVRLKLNIHDLADTIHAHPTAAEIIQIAARELIKKI